jgi:hypothetical protein
VSPAFVRAEQDSSQLYDEVEVFARQRMGLHPGVDAEPVGQHIGQATSRGVVDAQHTEIV